MEAQLNGISPQNDDESTTRVVIKQLQHDNNSQTVDQLEGDTENNAKRLQKEDFGHIDECNNKLRIKQPEMRADNELGSQNGSSKQMDEGTSSSDETTVTVKAMTPQKAKKRGIFVSYSPGASFEEKRLIAYTVKELKTDEIGFVNDIWFDKDDTISVPSSPFCYQQRLEIAEKCRAALVFLSRSYLENRLCKHEAKILLGRKEQQADSENTTVKLVRVFCVNYDCTTIPADYRMFEENIVVVNSEALAFSSVAEKASEIVGAFSVEMEKYAPLLGRRPPSPPNEAHESFLKKQMPLWDKNDVQGWLNYLKIPPRFCLSFEESMVDGFLLLSLDWKGSDLENHLMVDSKVVKRKLEQQLKGIRESQEKDIWYERIRKTKSKDDSVYIIYDPTDARFANNLRDDLKKKCQKVSMHKHLGQSKEDFLQLNGHDLGASSHVVVLMSDASAASVFVYSELMFADWLNKSLVVVMMKNAWQAMRPSMQAILGDCSAVDFENNPYLDSLDVLLYHLKPLRNMPAVILEQEFLDRMIEGLKPLRILANNAISSPAEIDNAPQRPKVFLSYHWDVQTKVQRLVHFLEKQGFECWTDVSGVSKQPVSRNSPLGSNDAGTLQTQIQRSMKASNAIVCCITPKYICSDNCFKDLNLAESLSKPIVPLMFQWMAWPPEGDAVKVKKILAPLQCIDLSNEKQFKRNQTAVVMHLKKYQVGLSLTPREGGQ